MPGELLHILASVALFGLTALAPGYVAGQITNVMGFRTRSPAWRGAIAICMSMVISPVLFVPIARLFSVRAAAYVSVAIGAICAAMWIWRVIRHGVGWLARELASARAAWIAVFVWGLISVGSLMDIQIGDRLYGSSVWLDYTKRVAAVDAITRTGIPPDNPFYHPGRPMPGGYYYGWYLLCSMTQVLSHGRVAALPALIGGAVWSGIGFLAVMAVALRWLTAESAARLRARWVIAVFLLLVTGLDIFPAFFKTLAAVLGSGDWPRTTEWWNEQISGFVDMTLWAPHHVAALVAGLFSVSLLRSACAGEEGRTKTVIIAGLGMASMVLISLFVGLIFAMFLVLWLIRCAWNRWWDEFVLVGASGLVTCVGAVWLFVDLAPTLGGPRTGQQELIAFSVRQFGPLRQIMIGDNITRWNTWQYQLSSFLCLPINWAMELGFFALGGFVYWLSMRRGSALTRTDRFGRTFFLISILTASFMRSSLAYNDLGWRTAIPAQVMLLLWSVPPLLALWDRWRNPPPTEASAEPISPVMRLSLVALMLVGLSSTAYDLFLMRFSEIITPETQWDPARAMNYRRAYDWISSELPENAIIQHNPTTGTEIISGLYAQRQVVISDVQISATLGADIKEFLAVGNEVARMFSRTTTPEQVAETCRKYGILALVVRDGDDAFRTRSSWAWRLPVLYTNAQVRIVSPVAR
ncbi:MAG: hypothetical protein ACREJC_12275 [Tepidisphaeraceae bacterium]